MFYIRRIICHTKQLVHELLSEIYYSGYIIYYFWKHKSKWICYVLNNYVSSSKFESVKPTIILRNKKDDQ